MGVSTDGQICYGVKFDEDYEFPWDADGYDGDEDEWWLVVSGYKYEGPPLFDESGWYAKGFSQDSPEVHAYFDSRSAWRKAHPLPIKTVNYCSGDYPMYIICAPSSFKRALRGYAEEFVPSELTPSADEVDALIEFCRVHLGIEDAQPKWYLSSLWS